jgi:hypothetical protein
MFGIFIALLFMLSGCNQVSEPTMKNTGYVLKVEDNRILVAEKITSEKYEDIKNIPFENLMGEGLSLIYLSYDGTEVFEKGNKVEYIIEGGIAKAKKITVID